MSTEQRKPVMRWLFRFIKWVVIPTLVLQAFMVAAFRSRYRPIIDGVRAFNKELSLDFWEGFLSHQNAKKAQIDERQVQINGCAATFATRDVSAPTAPSSNRSP